MSLLLHSVCLHHDPNYSKSLEATALDQQKIGKLGKICRCFFIQCVFIMTQIILKVLKQLLLINF